jgi:hypothetical protein
MRIINRKFARKREKKYFRVFRIIFPPHIFSGGGEKKIVKNFDFIFPSFSTPRNFLMGGISTPIFEFPFLSLVCVCVCECVCECL